MSELQVKTMAEFMAEGKEADILFWVGSAGSFDDRAKKILEELAKAAKAGKGAAQLDGRMIDAASARMAENIVNINKLIESK